VADAEGGARMSGEVVGWAMKQITGSPAAKLVLAKLADNANEQGLCWPSIELIIEHTELGQSTVYKHLAKLEELGLIRPIDITVRGAPLKGFQLSVPEANRDIPPRGKHKTSIPRGGNDFPPDEKTSLPAGKTIPSGGTAYKDEPSVEPSVEPPTEPHARERAAGEGDASRVRKQKYSDAFDRLWVEVRKWPEFTTVWSKPSAWDAWERLKALDELLSPGDMVAAAREYGRERVRLNAAARADRQTPQHTKHPANWLRDKVYLGIHEALQESRSASSSTPPRPISITAEDVAKLRGAGVSDDVVAQWFADGEFEAGPPPIFRAATRFKADWIAQRYGSQLQRAFGTVVAVTFKSAERAA
jgi:hypothetical protein